jgi:hypothetical protein
VLGLAAAACTETESAGPTALRIAFSEDGRRPETRVVWTLRCDPPAGSHPRSAIACRELERLGTGTLAPVPPETACAEIYGGPKVAVVSGTVRGEPVRTRLRRDNGCEIERWDRNWFLVPADRVR